MFARQFKPKINKASADYMVEEYKRLRQRDCSGRCGLYIMHRLVLTPNLLGYLKHSSSSNVVDAFHKSVSWLLEMDNGLGDILQLRFDNIHRMVGCCRVHTVSMGKILAGGWVWIVE